MPVHWRAPKTPDSVRASVNASSDTGTSLHLSCSALHYLWMHRDEQKKQHQEGVFIPA